MPSAAAALEVSGFAGWVAELLARRGIEDPASADAFLHPAMDHLHDPGQLAGMAEAVDRLIAAKNAGHEVALVGDYDVDGVTGCAILVAVLRACGLVVHPIIPHRMHDGYGFQPVHVERALELGVQLLITVDCGVSSHAAAAASLDAGIEVIVTDHHLPGEPLPEKVIQINPHQDCCSYPFGELSGAGLALKLAVAAAKAFERVIDPRLLVRVACLGTIADLVPLRGENRAIAAIGLEELARTRSPGLKALIEVAGLKPPFTAADVGFRLGPRLNAPGRLDSAEGALDLLLCRDPQHARRLAGELDQWNRDRQQEQRRVVTEAREALTADRDSLPAILVAWKETWHRGVVGVAAGRLAKELNRPTILLAVDGDQATGSGRSIPGIHLHDFLKQWDSDLLRFGGHAQAIGMTVKATELEDLRRHWQEAAEVWRERVDVRRFEYELELTPRQINHQLFNQLSDFEPFGQGNRQPLIRIPGPLHLERSPRFFGQGHLSAQAMDRNGGRIALLGWGWQERSASLEGEFEVLGYLEKDRYRGSVVRLVDCRPFAAADNNTKANGLGEDDLGEEGS